MDKARGMLTLTLNFIALLFFPGDYIAFNYPNSVYIWWLLAFLSCHACVYILHILFWLIYIWKLLLLLLGYCYCYLAYILEKNLVKGSLAHRFNVQPHNSNDYHRMNILEKYWVMIGQEQITSEYSFAINRFPIQIDHGISSLICVIFVISKFPVKGLFLKCLLLQI